MMFKEIGVLMFKLHTNNLPFVFSRLFQTKNTNNYTLETKFHSNLISIFCRILDTSSLYVIKDLLCGRAVQDQDFRS